MPGIDFEIVRAKISMPQVLDLVGFVAERQSGHQLRGSCPVHGPHASRSRTFSVNLRTNRYRCFKCGSGGGQLELWAAVQRIPVYEAALDL